MDPSSSNQAMSNDNNAMLQAQAQPHANGNGMGNGLPQIDSTNFMNQFNPQMMSMSADGTMSDPSLMSTGMSLPVMMQPMMFANGNPPAMPQQSTGISADEIALYDRQIRLWGMAAQAKIQRANILLITIKALANEIAKNLVLAGIGSLTILDGAPVTEADLGAQFFLAEADSQNLIGQNRAQAAAAGIRKLNPRVQVHVDTEGIKTKGPSYFAGFDIVIATDLDPDSFNLINTATRLHGKAFYAAGCHGFYGFIFSDLIEHDYVIERDASNMPTQFPKPETRTRSLIDVKTRKDGPKTIESVTKRELYSTWFLASDVANLPDEYLKSKRRLRSVSPTLSCLRALWEFMQIQGGRMPSTKNHDDLKMFTQIATQKHKALGLPSETLRPELLRSFLYNLGSEIAPVAAILGGQLAQDVINVLGQTQQPIQNMVIFDGNSMEAVMYPLHPEGVLGANLLSLGGADPMAGANGGGGIMMSGMPGMGLDPNVLSGGMPPMMPDHRMSQMVGMSMQDGSGMNVHAQQFQPQQDQQYQQQYQQQQQQQQQQHQPQQQMQPQQAQQKKGQPAEQSSQPPQPEQQPQQQQPQQQQQQESQTASIQEQQPAQQDEGLQVDKSAEGETANQDQ